MRIVFILFIALSTHLAHSTNNQLDILDQNWTQYELSKDINDKLIPYFFSLNQDGTWSDLDYTNRQRGNWPLKAHLRRTLEMARAYQKKDNALYKDETLKKNILKAYNFWVIEDIINPNWFNVQIGVPQNIGLIMLLMHEDIPLEQWEKGMLIMDRVKFGNKTGQNLVWVSSNIVLRSILKDDVTLLNRAITNIRSEMKIVNNTEGLQPDYSFHQHGRQLQFGNYGLHFLEDQVKWMFILKGSDYDYTPEQIALMRQYFEEGQRWVMWRGVYDINSSGRQLFPDEQLKKFKRVQRAAQQMQEIDEENTSLYQSIIQGDVFSGTKYFPFSELTIKRTDQYFISIRTCSSRLKGSESGNGENLSGYYLADGAMYVMNTGREYLNIYPYWDWRKVPGTTAVQDTVKLPENGWASYKMANDFVGGLVYKNCSITSMQYKRDSVVANKSYFIFPGVTVCLGAGISGTPDQHLKTTIEQNFKSGTVYSKLAGFKDKKNSPASSYWHQGSGYIINEANKVFVNVDEKKANWSRVVSWVSEQEKKDSIFTLGIDHGKGIKNGSYAYAVFPNITTTEFENVEQNQPYKILFNTKELQAVQFNQYTSVVFHEPGIIKLNDTLKLSCNVPAILFCRTNKDKVDISVCDPTQKLNMAKIEVSRKVNLKNKISTHKVVFPSAKKRGTPVIFNNI